MWEHIKNSRRQKKPGRKKNIIDCWIFFLKEIMTEENGLEKLLKNFMSAEPLYFKQPRVSKPSRMNVLESESIMNDGVFYELKRLQGKR